MGSSMENDNGALLGNAELTCKDGDRCEFEGNLEVIRVIPVFSRLDIRRLKLLAYLCRQINYVPGHALFEQGTMDGTFYHILSGEVEVSYTTEEGEEKVLGRLGPETSIGVLSLLGEMNRLYTVRAVSDVTCLTLSHRKFWSNLSQCQETMSGFLEQLGTQVVNWERNALDALNTTGRLDRDSLNLNSSGVSLL